MRIKTLLNNEWVKEEINRKNKKWEIYSDIYMKKKQSNFTLQRITEDE